MAGSEDAFAELVHRFQRPVFSLIVRMVRDRGVAEDLAQEVFIKAYRALDTFDPKRKVSSWLFKIAHNATIDHLRRRRLETVPLESDDERVDPLDTIGAPAADRPDRVAERADFIRGFEEALQDLRTDYREVLVLPVPARPGLRGDRRRVRSAAGHGEDPSPPGTQAAGRRDVQSGLDTGRVRGETLLGRHP